MIDNIINADTMQARLLKMLSEGWVSPITALRGAGCFSLAQRVSNWRAMGMVIDDRWLHLQNGKRVKEYRIGTLQTSDEHYFLDMGERDRAKL